ncbi:hypothetical protein SM02_05365 [Klebsiella pneumoniae]|nr:hypothetical protein SM02_05365 [Klebsiella pneumoniae]
MQSEAITGVVLAGGRATRMGGIDKGLQALNGRPLWRHVAEALAPQVDELVISANRHLEQWRASGFPVFRDIQEGYQGLLWSSFFGHADQMVGLCTGGQLGGRAGQRFVLCG